MASDLSYFIPHHGRPKVSLCIPESFNLYVCPPSCVRRVSIRALRNDTRGAMGFLFLTEADVATGAYEHAVAVAVAEALTTLERPPRAFFIHLNCIDDFLGTDEDALLDELRGRFPGLGFAVVRMNPIAADRGLSTGLRIHDRLYSMLEPTPHRDSAVNLVGTFADIGDDCELFGVMRAWGVREVRQLFSCADFEAYRRLASSRLNVVLAHIGSYAAANMERRLDIPRVDAPVSYDFDEIGRQYRAIGSALGRAGGVVDGTCSQEGWAFEGRQEPGVTADDEAARLLAQAEGAARDAVAHAREVLGDTPVIVDSSAAMRPFALAKALAGYGFSVCAVFALHEKDDDAEERAWVAAQAPGIAVVRGESYEGILDLGLPADAVCIGFDCAYLLKARRFVDVQKDEGLFGYQAVRRLMRLMEAALDGDTVWE